MGWGATDPISKRRQGVTNILPTSPCAMDKLCPEPWTLDQGQPTTPALQPEGLTVPGEKVMALPQANSPGQHSSTVLVPRRGSM